MNGSRSLSGTLGCKSLLPSRVWLKGVAFASLRATELLVFHQKDANRPDPTTVYLYRWRAHFFSLHRSIFLNQQDERKIPSLPSLQLSQSPLVTFIPITLSDSFYAQASVLCSALCTTDSSVTRALAGTSQRRGVWQ